MSIRAKFLEIVPANINNDAIFEEISQVERNAISRNNREREL